LQSHNYPYNHSHGAKIDHGPYRQWEEGSRSNLAQSAQEGQGEDDNGYLPGSNAQQSPLARYSIDRHCRS